MAVTKVEYLERFLEAVDRVVAGRPGSISEDRWLVNYYDADKLSVVSGYLDCDDERVRAETVLLLTDVRERAVLDKVRDMRQRDSERVRLACMGYLSALQSDDELIPQLFDVMDHTNGSEFMRAANRMASCPKPYSTTWLASAGATATWRSSPATSSRRSSTSPKVSSP